jgi:hypothetical protein
MKKLLVVISIIILIPLIILLSALVYIKVKYNAWEKDFESSIVQEYHITSEKREDFELEVKFIEFTLSNSPTETLEISVEETGSLIFSLLKRYTGENLKLTEVYIKPSFSTWEIYAKFRYKRQSYWVSIDLNKDRMQTAQLYVTDFKLGPYSVNRYYDLTERINNGISNAILTANENGFTGRYLENIELLENSIIIKGARY